MIPAPKRWFRWSLPTMFVVVTVAGCWLGYSLNWIRQRHEVLAREFHGRRCTYGVPPRDLQRADVPWTLRMFGEQPYYVVYWSAMREEPTANFAPSEAEQAELSHVRRLFPEALVIPIP